MPEVLEYYTLVYTFTARPPKTRKKKIRNKRNNEEQRDNKNSDKAPEP